MKKLLLICTFLCIGIAYAQLAETPQYEFSSTSSYKYSDYHPQYTIPISELQAPFSTNNLRPKKSIEDENPGYNPADPNWQETSIGDPNVYIITVLIFLYFIYIYMKKQD